jgi:crotonobetainyl-CoA:carnitine CoA-transferase CaiB-like acyl-CoA transferase
MTYQKESNINTMGALKGIKIVDLTRLLPGPYCTMILADHGAQVISIEDRRFLKDSHFIKPLYRNKKHMSLDLKTEAGRKIFFKLVKDADVVIEQFRPGVVKRLGVDYPSVKKVNPKIIYCSITGYGQDGPYKDRAGHDVNYLAMAGVLDLNGETGRTPVIPGVPVGDIAGGSMNAVIGILLALVARQQTGEGQYIDISMTDGVLGLLSLTPYLKELFGQTPCRGDETFPARYACYRVYETCDNRYVSIGAVEPHFWKALCEHLKVPQYAAKQYDEACRQEIIDFMTKTFKSKTMAEWETELGPKEVCFAPVRNVDEVMKDPFYKEKGSIVDMPKKNSRQKIPVVGTPVRLSQTPGGVRSMPVEFGENTEEILMEIGYSKEEIYKLSEDKIV